MRILVLIAALALLGLAALPAALAEPESPPFQYYSVSRTLASPDRVCLSIWLVALPDYDYSGAYLFVGSNAINLGILNTEGEIRVASCLTTTIGSINVMLLVGDQVIRLASTTVPT